MTKTKQQIYFHTDTPPTFKPNGIYVEPKIFEAEKTLPELFFRCNFEPSPDTVLFYQVYWFKNEQLIWISPEEIDDLSIKTQLELPKDTKVGFEVTQSRGIYTLLIFYVIHLFIFLFVSFSFCFVVD